MMNELDIENVEKGDVVQYENKYHAATIARVQSIEHEPEEEYDYQTVELEILDPIFGRLEEGEEITVGRTLNPGLQHYVEWKLKEPGAMTEYYNGNGFDSVGEMNKHIKQLAEKYEE